MNKKILMVILVCISFLAFLGCTFMSRKNMNNKLTSMKIETEEVPVYVCYDTIYRDGKSLNLKQVLEREKGNNVYFEDIFVVKKGRIWFLYREAGEKESNAQIWNLASVTPEGTDMIIHYSNEFCASKLADREYLYRDHRYTKEHFSMVSGYYYNEKIVLTDHDKLIEYDMTNGIVKECKAEEYVYPEVSLTADIQENQKIYFTNETETKIIDLEAAADSSEAFAIIKELESEKDWEGSYLLKYLFDNVQVVEEDVFIVCRILNYWGETHAVVAKYDFESNTCQYAFNYFTDDVISSHLYIVPEIE